MINIEPTAAGVILPVHAQAGARKNGINGVQAGRLKVSVTQIPVRGKANKALIEVLAHALGVKAAQITLLAGDAGNRKKFLVAGANVSALQARLAELVRPNARTTGLNPPGGLRR